MLRPSYGLLSVVSSRMSTFGENWNPGAEAEGLFRQASSECNLIYYTKVIPSLLVFARLHQSHH